MSIARYVYSSLFVALAATAPLYQANAATTLEKIISSKTLRCGVQLDFPPAGFRNQANEPDGYDVQYCKDMAQALNVKAEIVETTAGERVPALVSKRVDVLVASTTINPQRALTVSFTQPYVNYSHIVLTRKNTSIEKFEDLKGRNVGGVTGTTAEKEMLSARKQWNDAKGTYTGFGTESESYLALNQGKIDGMILNVASAAALIQSGQFPSLVVKGEAPTPADLCGIAVRKDDADFLGWLKVFVWTQARTGRYAELYAQYFGAGEAPALTVPNSDF
ncbi:transporter substrate-binding domain-containing protein [Pseudomonas protegens]|uniref:ABC transporter substrate-binding protein n=1 Tax=Pseudomonas protegens TaxID=380021 RepID=UPI001C8E5393|nr:transporter substrate-binding domain-containing protein [Pseudomonas protegens]QZI68653.1 transporter substrate-binding domain-containing protein [Pseudomonas protegens]